MAARSKEDMSVEPGVTMSEEKGKFRFQNKFILLTYKEHLEKGSYIDWFMEKIPSTVWIRLAHETGDENCPYEHTHVVADLGKAFQTRNCRFFDYDGVDKDGILIENTIHPHIKKLTNKKAFEDAKKYISKEDQENSDLIEEESWIKGVMSCNTATNALVKYAKKPSDVTGILAIRGITRNDYRKRHRNTDFTPREWQQQMHDELMEVPNDRTIQWIVDEEGNSGKSRFAEWMEDLYPNKFLFTTDLGTSRDAATIILNSLQGGWEQWGIFINLSRGAENHDRMYQYLEDIKDGRCAAQKYNGQIVRFDSPHVVVFSNWMPKTKALSFDRWKIRIMKTVDGEYKLSKPLKKITIRKISSNGFTSSVPKDDSGEE